MTNPNDVTQQAHEAVVDEVFKAAPPVGVSTLSILGVPLPNIIYLLTIVYLIVQIVCLIYSTYKRTHSTTKGGNKN